MFRVCDVKNKVDVNLPEGLPRYLFIRDDNDGVTGWLHTRGRTTGPLWDEIKPLVNKEYSIIDAGAHLGIFAIEFAGLTNKKYYCFEPQKDLYLQLCANLLLNGHCKVAVPYGCGLGTLEQDGSYVGIYDSPENHNDTTRLVGSEAPPKFYGSKDEVVDQVLIRALDKVIPSFDKIGFLKIDVEGYEIHVLNGALQLLERDKPLILIESFEEPSKCHTFDPLKKLGYSIFKTFNSSIDYIAVHPESTTVDFNTTLIKWVINNEDILIKNSSFNIIIEIISSIVPNDKMSETELFSYYRLLMKAYYETNDNNNYNKMSHNLIHSLEQGYLDNIWKSHCDHIKILLSIVPLSRYDKQIILTPDSIVSIQVRDNIIPYMDNEHIDVFIQLLNGLSSDSTLKDYLRVIINLRKMTHDKIKFYFTYKVEKDSYWRLQHCNPSLI